MSEPQHELKELKQEVADLWVRFRKEEPVVVEDEPRRTLSQQAKALEARRRELSERRVSLRSQLDVARRRTSRLAPVARFFGGLVGVVVTSALVLPLVPELAAETLSLGVPQGAAVLTFALVLLALAVSGGEG